jgi:hypothetical protein
VHELSTAAGQSPWADKLGPKLVVHDGHGYSHWDKLVPTPKVVRGRTVVGVYFSADWCNPCVQFTPLLMNLHVSHRAKNTVATTSIPPFEVILISQCQDAAATEHYFPSMPWTVMPHADASGPRGAAGRPGQDTGRPGSVTRSTYSWGGPTRKPARWPTRKPTFAWIIDSSRAESMGGQTWPKAGGP